TYTPPATSVSASAAAATRKPVRRGRRGGTAWAGAVTDRGGVGAGIGWAGGAGAGEGAGAGCRFIAMGGRASSRAGAAGAVGAAGATGAAGVSGRPAPWAAAGGRGSAAT